jgi:hypothetical protein
MASRGKKTQLELHDEQQSGSGRHRAWQSESAESDSADSDASEEAASASPANKRARVEAHAEESQEGSEEGAPSAGGSADEQPRESSISTEMQKLIIKLYTKEQRIKELEESEGALKLEVDRLRAKCGEESGTSTAIVPVVGGEPRNQMVEAVPPTHTLAPMRSLAASASGSQDFSLALLMPMNYDTIAVPYKFKTTGHHFPHRVQSAKDGTRKYVIESRIYVQFACQLVERSAGDRLRTELSLPTRNPVRFKLEVCSAVTNEAVKREDLKVPVETLLDPADSQIVTMKNGEIKFKFHTKFTSRMTKAPSGQEFFFRISCMNSELERFDLDTMSVPFIVVSREVNAKAA